MTTNDAVGKTPLYDCHLEAEARMVDFAGWRMPVQYAGVIDEHRAVRTAAGLFDVSHMGEIRVAGPGAEAALQRLTPNNVARLRPGRIHYSALLTERGTYIDDLLVYRLADEEFLLVVNAANSARDLEWVRTHGGEDAEVEDVSDRYALLALQGPRAEEILTGLTEAELGEIGYYGFARAAVAGQPALVSRTGYTGEDGFEPVWARAIRCGWRRQWRSTATSLTTPRPRSRRRWGGRSSGRRATSSAARRCWPSATRAPVVG
jgi:aminomethyltransferase